MLVQATDIEQECLLLNPVFNLRYVKQKECHSDSLELVDGDIDGKPMAVDGIKKENQENMENKYNTREPKVAMDSCFYDGPPHSNVASIQKEVEGNNMCYGHAIDSRGWVHMKLRWKDTGDESFGVVRHVMNNRWERKAFGNTWIEYCNSQGIKDDGFRMMGRSVVKNIEGHDWADCGRPKARINWMHGGITTEMVKDAREPKMADTNGFKAAWEVYCDKIGNTEEGFVRGNVDKSHRVPAKKK